MTGPPHRKWVLGAWMFPIGLVVAALVITLHGQNLPVPPSLEVAVAQQKLSDRIDAANLVMTDMKDRIWRIEGLLYSLVIVSIGKLVFDEARSRRRS